MPEEAPSGGKEDLLARNRELEARVQELQETLDAIRSGEVDAIVVAKGGASRIYTLEGPDQPYRALVESISEGALTLSPEGMILYANARFASMVGLPSDRIIGTSFLDHISPKDQPAFQTSYRRLPEGPCRGRVTLRLGPGSLPVAISMSPLSAEPGSRISVVVTDRKEDEAEIRESEERLRLAQEAGHVGVWDLDPATNEVRWTPELETIYGVEPGSVRTYQDFTTLVHPDDVRMVDARREEAVRGRKSFEFEFRIKRRGGEIGWVYCRGAAVYDAEGRPTRVFGVNIDITGRKQAEEALEASRNQLQGIIDNTPAYVYVLDREERFLIANRALAGLLNTTPGQMIGKRRHEFMPAETADWHEENDRKVVVAGHPLELEEYGTFQGKETTFLTTKFPLFDAKNGVYAVAGISVDITGRKQTEDEIRQRSAELRAANEELTRFNRTMVDRELRMIELKREVNDLSRELGKPPRYSTGSIEEKRP